MKQNEYERNSDLEKLVKKTLMYTAEDKPSFSLGRSVKKYVHLLGLFLYSYSKKHENQIYKS